MRVTAVIPTYNCAPFIAEAIESALNQTYPLSEVLVIDDGSTDGTESAVASYLDRITYIRTPRRGVGSARNEGLDRAKGDLIAFLDGDDVWHREKTALQVKAFGAVAELLGVASDFDRTDVHGRLLQANAIRSEYPVFETYHLDWNSIFPATGLVDEHTLHHGSCFPSLFCGNFIKTSTLMVRRGTQRYPGGFKTQEDYRYFLDLSLAGTLGHLDRSTLAYRRRPGQISDRAHARRIAEDSTDAVLDYLDHARRLVAPKVIRRRLADRYCQTGIARLGDGDRRGARRALASAALTKASPYTLALYASTWLPPRAVAYLRGLKRSRSVSPALGAKVF